jgi:two-component system response regulator PilR (NtrC family)
MTGTQNAIQVPLAASVPRILIVDDEPDLRELLELTVLKMGFDVETAGTLSSALALSDRKAFSLCLTDMRLPDGDGISLVKHFAEHYPLTPVAVITAFGSTETAVSSLKAGAFDYVTKPVGLEQLRKMILSALQLQDKTLTRKQSNTTNNPDRELIGTSAPIALVRSTIAKLARSMAPVAIYGESGTGKELAARAIHASSPRSSAAFVAVNCGAIPENLMEAEFFGYRKGAFTGADTDRDGFFQAAHGGTLMLDEVAELPLAMQVKLLRAIQERRVRKVGSTAEEAVDVRIISATHRNLPERVASGAFRQDLFYRLNVIEMRMPPLRDRVQDIPQIALSVLAKLGRSEGRAVARSLTDGALARLNTHAFAGNVRELENMLERASAFASEDVITEADLGFELDHKGDIATANAPLAQQAANEASGARDLDRHLLRTEGATEPVAALPSDTTANDSRAALPAGVEHYLAQLSLPRELSKDLEAIERAVIEIALEHCKFNRTATAKALGLTFRQLRYRMQQLEIR